ncbi:hypothetical protein CR203_17650 [Salipaludibacillus neizhouensis]|uniref:S1 motif domain-containing protein n=1 Tax=Salipaludibacillus neizhouensis TaxID=885475 RepID=A0A3A9K0J8_9BACI|nr:hypothetical protein CR203_17650 [Salipaludibacillus neizhouensis]
MSPGSTRFKIEWGHANVRKIIIHRYSTGVRGAVLEQGTVVEWLIDQEIEGDIPPGVIIQGKVIDILPGMDAAFIDIGAEKNGFLLKKELVDYQQKKNENNNQPVSVSKPINSLLTKGQRVIVQVKKEETGTKGAKLTEIVSFPGKYIVYMPHGGYVAVSKKMNEDLNRDTFRALGQAWIQGSEGIIFRTLAEDANPEDVRKEFEWLREQYHSFIAKGNESPSKVMYLYNESSIFSRVGRDYLHDDETIIVVDNREDYLLLKKQLPVDKSWKLEFHQEKQGIFSYFDLQTALDRSLKPFLWLRSGGSLFINYTEAMTVIDVNTAKFTGKNDQKETAFKTNKEAAAVIAEQLRLRDIGGIVLIDFIDMKSDKEQEEILQVIKRTLRNDRTTTNVLGFTKLGLLEMTRKKTRKPLHEALQIPCQTCDGSGWIKTSEELTRELEDELFARRFAIEDAYLVEVEDRMMALLTAENKKRLTLLKQVSGKELFMVPSEKVSGYEIRLAGDREEIQQQWEMRQHS